jgi:hypothetical protein
MNAGEARDHMKTVLNSKDVLFVARLQGNWASLNFGDNRNNWLKERTGGGSCLANAVHLCSVL